VTPYYPRWVSIDVPRELQAGKYPRAVMVDVGTVR